MLCERNPSIHLVARVALTQPLRPLHPLTDMTGYCFRACHVCHARIAGEAGLDVGCGSEWERGESVSLAIHSAGDTSIPATAAAAANADYVSVTTGKTEMSGGWVVHRPTPKRQKLRLLTLMEQFRVHSRNEMTFSCSHDP